MNHLVDLFSPAYTPDHPVAWRGDQTICWVEFRERVSRLARQLAERPEQSWLLARADPFDFVVGLFALWHADKRAVLPPSLQTGTLASMRERVDADIDAVDWSSPAPDLPLSPLDPNRARIDLHTSGSTGEPKRVEKTLGQLATEVAVLERCWGDDPGPVLATVPHHHIYGLLFRLLRPLAAGHPFDTETCAAPELLLARLERIGPGMVISSPAQLARMHELIDLKQLAGRATRIISSGGPLPAAVAARFHAALGQAPLEILGSTETGGIAWRIQDQDDAWTPLPGVQVRFAGDSALSLTSPFLADTAPLATGDAGEALADGRFRLLGRLDRIVKIEEKRLSLAEMEERLRQHPWVMEAAVTLLPGRRQRIGAALVLSADARVLLAELGRHAFARQLRQHLGHWFEAVLLPRLWRYPETLPYSDRGKLAAADLARLFNNEESTRD